MKGHKKVQHKLLNYTMLRTQNMTHTIPTELERLNKEQQKGATCQLKKKTIKYTFIWYLWLKFNFILQMHGGVKGKQLCSENRRHAALKGRSRTAYKTIKQDMPQLGW